ncbi:hypothetical protein ACLM5H_04885 [Fredinandcohnia humi]
MASVKTLVGRQKWAQAHAGAKALPPVVKIAFGSGGTNPDGSPKNLTGNEVALFNKLIEKAVAITYPVTTTARYTARVDADADNLVGKIINEACLIDSEGDVVAIKTFTNKGLDIGTVLEFDYDAEF